MKKVVFSVTCLLLASFIICWGIWWRTGVHCLVPITITVGTTLYHFAMRLAVGYAIDGCFHNQIKGDSWWFRQRSFEPSFYRFLRVRKWKHWIPAFAPEWFNVGALEQTIGATCQAELVHEVIIVLSFLPLGMIPLFGEALVFFITSILAACLDSVLVILQRYNRPRLQKLLKRQLLQIRE